MSHAAQQLLETMHENGALNDGELSILLSVVRADLADAWDEGATKASPYGGGYLRSITIENPHRSL